jgi:octaprenyl-diphosphate synthase
MQAALSPVQKPAPQNLNEILSNWRPQLRRLEQSILLGIRTDIPLLTRVAEHILLAGGKRLRPAMVFLGGAFGEFREERLQVAAQVVEYLHTATLLHDDVVDNADMRRKQQAARTIWGNEASVLTGDYLLSMAFHMLTKLRDPEVLKLMSETTTRMARGELLQLTRSYNSANEQEYLEIITNKTACLFASAIRMGGLLAGVQARQTQALYEYGMSVGLAFQIVDDVLDYTDSDNTGKPVGTDLQERKITLPLSHLLDKSSASEHQRLKEILASPVIQAEHVTEVIELMRSYGSLEYATEAARQYVRNAQQQLTTLPTSQARDSLHHIAGFIVQRNM